MLIDRSMDKSQRLDETDYEPAITKKVQEHYARANVPNGKNVVTKSEGIRVKEIFDYPSKSSPSKKKKEKEPEALKVKGKEDETTKKKVKSDTKGKMEEEIRFNKKYPKVILI